MNYWLLIRRLDNAVLCCQITDPGDISNDRMVVKEWHRRPVPAHDPAEGVESYDPTLGLSADDPRLGSEIELLRKRVEELETRLLSLERRSAYQEYGQ